MKVHHWFGLVWLAIEFLADAPRAFAQIPVPTTDADRQHMLSVNGTGEVRAKPNRVEIELRTSGTAELSGDAIVKYRDSKRRMMQAFGKLKFDNLEVTERGMTVASTTSNEQMQAMMRGAQPTGGDKSQLQVARTLRITLTKIQDVPEEELMVTLGKIFDTAKDSAVGLAPSPESVSMARMYGQPVAGPTINFVLDEVAELREQAYAKAMEDARVRAQRLAKLTGVKLGGVLAAYEVQVSGDDVNPVGGQTYYSPQTVFLGTQSETQGVRFVSNTFMDIPFRVRLNVRFAIVQPVQETAAK